MGFTKNKKQIEEFLNKSIEEYNKLHPPKQRKWKKAWERNGTRRPFPALYEALQMYGEKIYYPQPKYVEDGYCKWCGKLIENKRRKEFCCKECSDAFGRCTVWNRGRDPYSLRILYRDNFTCQKCGQFLAYKNKHDVYIPIDDGMEVHHIQPVCEGGDDSPENLTSLCIECHKEETRKQRSKNDNIEEEIS